jgi:TonB family protein
MISVRRFFLPGLGILAAAIFFLAGGVSGQNAPEVSVPPKIYPDNTAGLKQLVKDILKAQKEGDFPRAAAFLDSMVLPNYKQWYPENFDDGAVDRALPNYQAAEKTISVQLANFFVTSQTEGMTDVEVVRFDSNCDDDASEQTFNTLDARLKPIPLYELRLMKGNTFKRLFAFVYVAGGFRFIITPDFSAGPLRGRRSRNTEAGDVDKPAPLIKQGGTVQAARLINKVSPAYPEIARNERLSGTVRLHAIIDKEGKIAELRVISGRCSLARASVDAVRKWQYKPTLFNGAPVAVDTTIDVIFSLNN